ncbi:MAG: hypothetical protein NVS4B9_22440 [Ktedonobacteraceae bacterium]
MDLVGPTRSDVKWKAQRPGNGNWVSYGLGEFLFFVGSFLSASKALRGGPVLKRRYERREPTDDWQQLHPLLKDTAQIQYEIIQPIVLWGETPKERAAETGMSQRTIYYRANLFDATDMASLLPSEPPPPVARQDKRALPSPIRQKIVDLHAEYPGLRSHEMPPSALSSLADAPVPRPSN